ncbi:MAG: hypothetical protein FIA97_17750 [Methylococcaceae bacterium]|nr:hypothetical protein [Methylococcaceae bacterium]
MNRKTLLVPVFRLDCPQYRDFMELVVEPQDGRGQRPWFYHLQGLGLEPAIHLASQALQRVRGGTAEPLVYWTNPKLPLSQWGGVALALALSVWAAHERCGYDEIISVGQLEGAGGQGLQVVDTGYTGRSLAAVADLGPRPRPACLILPERPVLGLGDARRLFELEDAGIRCIRVGSLESAAQACRQDASIIGRMLA